MTVVDICSLQYAECKQYRPQSFTKKRTTEELGEPSAVPAEQISVEVSRGSTAITADRHCHLFSQDQPVGIPLHNAPQVA